MKKISFILMGLILSASSLFAQSSAVQKVAKSVFSLTTFDKDGGIVASTQGVFIDNKGTAISTFKPFIGATKATIVDGNGKSMEVDAILGADELYDVAKFRVIGATTPATIATTEAAAGSSVWLVPYSIKKPAFQQEDINKVEKFHDSFNYYVFTNSVPENAVGCPFVNKNGQVIGIMHTDNGNINAIDANYIKQLTVTGLSTLDAALRETGIRTALPNTEQEAITMMTLKKSTTSPADYAKYANEFITLFPTSAFGYKEKGTLLTNDGKYEEAAKLMEEGIKKATNKDEAHSNYADIIYQKIIHVGDSTYKDWTLDKAIEETQKAYNIKAEPIYKHQEAQITFYKGDYQKAYDMFMGLTSSKLNSGEIYYEAAQSKMHLNAPDKEIITLLDSAVNAGNRNNMGATYYLARAQYLDSRGMYRKALQDYNQYDSLAAPINVAFFYARYKCEMNLRMWQQALIDIARTCYIAPNEPTYFAEWASLDLRVKRYEEGIAAANQCIKLAPEYSDGYLLLGLLQIESKQKEEGIKNLEKAKDLGDTRADDYLKKYK